MVSVNDELRAELMQRAARDQAARKALSPGQEMRQWQETVEPVDRANTARMREVVSEHGWPGHQLVGEAGAHAAWLLVQHAPPDFQEEYLPLLEDAVARGDASPKDLAYLTDRVLMHRGKPQLYGTQYQVRDGVPTLWAVQDPGGLDARRAALGLEPEAQNRARLLPDSAPAAAEPGDGPSPEPLGTRDTRDTRGASILDDLRTNMSREEITRYLAEFGALVGADASSQKLARATGGQVDLAVEAHRIAAIGWLRSWGCRHLRRADTPRTSEALRTWWEDWGAQLPGGHETLTGLGEAGLVVAGRAYAALRAAPAARRSVKGRDLDVAFGDTATAKLLFAIRPQIFPPWDEAIRLAFGRPGGADAYVRMLRLSAAALDGLARRLAVSVTDLPEILGRPGSSPPKLVDEFLLIRITRER
jgi:hypothetical protein